jgi:hypothetical protein
MADTSPKKKAAAKLKKPAAHPKYSKMVGKAIAAPHINAYSFCTYYTL